MADTRTQAQVANWVRDHWMPRKFGQGFRQERILLSSGGKFRFSAVSADGRIVASISTSGGKTSSGKLGVGKLQKLRSDMLFLTMASAKRRLLILTQADMYEVCLKEVQRGRVPGGIEFHLAALPTELVRKLNRARERASREVQPSVSVE